MQLTVSKMYVFVNRLFSALWNMVVLGGQILSSSGNCIELSLAGHLQECPRGTVRVFLKALLHLLELLCHHNKRNKCSHLRNTCQAYYNIRAD
jgi:hypothetical protein